MDTTPPLLATKRRIKRFGALQLGKMLGVLYGVMGLLIAPFFFLISSFAARLPSTQRVGVLAFSAGFAFFIPLLYAGIGFVFGVLGAWIYNLVAKWIGGIEVEVE